MTETKFEYTIGSDVDFENLIADIGFDNNLVAILTQEEGIDNLRIRIYPPKNNEYWDFDYKEFDNIIQRAKKGSMEIKKRK